ncbi:MAG: hypothetical protein AB9Q17_14215 [Candidatus Reddybacter sp.]
MADIQFVLIKKHLVMFAVLSLLGIALVSTSNYLKGEAVEKGALIKAGMKSSRVKMANIISDKNLIGDYQSRYSDLIVSGFFGAEKRLLWIEQLEVTSKRLELPDLHYKINAQSVIGKDTYSTPSGISLHKSQFTFQTSLLHEGDLLELIADLQGLKSGLLVVEHCELSRRHQARVKKPAKKKSTGYNFHVLCDMSWYTSSKLAPPGLPSRGKR